MKVGYQAAFQVKHQYRSTDSQISYTFNNRTPISLTQRAAPFGFSNRTRFDAFYVQDSWTRGRMTLQGGLRYEHAWSWFPGGENGILADNQFGSSKCSRKRRVSRAITTSPPHGRGLRPLRHRQDVAEGERGKYLQAANNDAQFTMANNAVTFQQTTVRTWTDANRDYVADCDLRSPAANGECGVWQNSNFGNPLVTTVVNPDVLSGWGVRPFDWQYGLSLQHEILPRVSLEVELQPSCVEQFLLHRQPRHRSPGLRRGRHHGAEPCEPARRRGFPVSFLTRKARTAWARRTTTTRSERLRRRDGLLAGRGRERQRTHEQRSGRAGRHQQRARCSRLLRHPGDLPEL